MGTCPGGDRPEHDPVEPALKSRCDETDADDEVPVEQENFRGFPTGGFKHRSSLCMLTRCCKILRYQSLS